MWTPHLEILSLWVSDHNRLERGRLIKVGEGGQLVCFSRDCLAAHQLGESAFAVTVRSEKVRKKLTAKKELRNIQCSRNTAASEENNNTH